MRKIDNSIKERIIRKLRAATILTMLSIIFCSCEEIIDPNLPKGGKRLVIEGWITDQPGPYYIRLTKTRDYSFTYNDTVVFEKGAKVRITDSQGLSVNLSEVSPGTYATDSAQLRGKIGLSYALEFETQDGRYFASAPQKLLAVSKIDTIYYTLDFSDLDENDNPFLEGYLQFRDPEDENFYLLISEEILRDGKVFSIEREPLTDKFFNGNTAKVHVLGPFNPEVRAISTLQRFQLLSLSREAYNFWSLVNLQTADIGSAYDPPPTPIIGNVRNINDEKDFVLGFFGASAVNKTEIFVKSR